MLRLLLWPQQPPKASAASSSHVALALRASSHSASAHHHKKNTDYFKSAGIEQPREVRGHYNKRKASAPHLIHTLCQNTETYSIHFKRMHFGYEWIFAENRLIRKRNFSDFSQAILSSLRPRPTRPCDATTKEKKTDPLKEMHCIILQKSTRHHFPILKDICVHLKSLSTLTARWRCWFNCLLTKGAGLKRHQGEAKR